MGRSVAFRGHTRAPGCAITSPVVHTLKEHSCSLSPRITANIWLSLHILLELTQISAPGLFFRRVYFQQASPSSLCACQPLSCSRRTHAPTRGTRQKSSQSIDLTASIKSPEKRFQIELEMEAHLSGGRMRLECSSWAVYLGGHSYLTSAVGSQRFFESAPA